MEHINCENLHLKFAAPSHEKCSRALAAHTHEHLNDRKPDMEFNGKVRFGSKCMRQNHKCMDECDVSAIYGFGNAYAQRQ